MSFFIALPFLLFSSAAAGEKQYAGVLPAGWDAGREAWLQCLRDTGASVKGKIDTGKTRCRAGCRTAITTTTTTTNHKPRPQPPQQQQIVIAIAIPHHEAALNSSLLLPPPYR